MKPKKTPSTDADLFREAMADVRPLKPDNRHRADPVRPAPVPAQRVADERRVLDELLLEPDELTGLETGEELMFLRDGRPRQLLRRLRRGAFSIEDSIDLHHMDRATAHDVLVRFLASATRRGLGCIRIVHGKGLRSRSQPVLKILTARLLRKHPVVIAYASCRPVDGGTGAVLALLRHDPKRLR
jgi:DNA-nicking Smr family endonuclease